MRWDAFEDACPEIAEIARERFALDQLVMLGTIRRDGSPRVSPCECDFGAGRLFVSMMWRSKKALDLLRDPRIVVHSVTSNKEGTDGDVKIYGRAIDERDPEVREAFREAIRTRMDWAPEEPDVPLLLGRRERRRVRAVRRRGGGARVGRGTRSPPAPPARLAHPTLLSGA